MIMSYKMKQITEPINSLDKSILDLLQIIQDIPDDAPEDGNNWTITDENGNEITLGISDGKLNVSIARKHWNLSIEVLNDKP